MDTGSYRFTTEGVPARAQDYVEDGRLVEPILDLKYARRLGRASGPRPLSSDSLRLTGGRAMAEAEALAGRRRAASSSSRSWASTRRTRRAGTSRSPRPRRSRYSGGALGGAVKAVLTGNLFEALRDPTLGLVTLSGLPDARTLFTGSVGVDAEA